MYTFKVKHEEMLYEFHSTQKTNQLVRKDMDTIEIERLFSYTHIYVCFACDIHLRGYHTLQGDNSLKSVERFDDMMFVCRFQASR